MQRLMAEADILDHLVVSLRRLGRSFAEIAVAQGVTENRIRQRYRRWHQRHPDDQQTDGIGSDTPGQAGG